MQDIIDAPLFSTLSMMKTMAQLSRWVNPLHLEAKALDALKATPHTVLEAGIVIDDFLNEKTHQALCKVIDEEADFKKNYRLYKVQNNVTREEFETASENERAYQVNDLHRIKPEYKLSRNWITYLKYHHDYGSVMSEFFSEMVGVSLSFPGYITHSSRIGDFLKLHSDNLQGRRIGTVLYLSSSAWEKNYGGDLVMYRKSAGKMEEIHRIAFKPNRLVIFAVSDETFHEVELLTKYAEGKVRTSDLFWFEERKGSQN